MNKKLLLVLLFAIANFVKTNGQCSITASTNASTLTCGTAPLSACGGILYIGNGVSAMTLTMNANLNLTCLGAIQLIVRNNAAIDFSSGNSDLTLAAGSSIAFEAGSVLNGGSTCSASDRIIIDGVRIASCNGGGGALYTFPGLVSNGYSPITVSASPTSVCGSGAFNLTATPSPTTGATVYWYSVPSGGAALASGTSYTTPILTSSATYYAAAQYAGYTTIRRPVTVIVIPNNTSSAQSSTAPLCVNALMANFTHTTTGATGIGVATGLPAGVMATWALNTITISGTPSATGSFNYTIPLTGGCGTVNATGTLTVNALPAAPTIGTITQPTCTLTTGSVALSNLPAGSWTLTRSGTSSAITAGAGTTTTISGLAAGTYTFSVNDGTCNSLSSGSVVITAASTVTWNGSAWLPGTPTASTPAIINGNYTTATNGSFTACSLTVNPGFTINVSSNTYLQIQNNFTNNGTVNVLNNGSLVQVNNAAVNTGTANIYRDTNVKLFDYVYWSSPVNGFSVNNIAPSATLRYRWATTAPNANGGEGNWLSASGIMNIGEGYIVRTPNIAPYNNTTANTLTATFTGSPNNGIYNLTVFRGNDYTTPGTQGIARTAIDDNWNLLGNPYPSAIGVNEFLTANSGAIEGFVKVWTHGQLPTSTVSHFYQYYTNNYFASDFLTVNSTGATSGPGDYMIGAGQGFMVQMLAGAPGSATVTFNNAMRSSSFANNQFYRIDNSKNVNSNENGRIWLELISNSQTNRILVGYLEGATNNKDHHYDAITDNKNVENFYSIINSEPMTIQGKGLPFVDSDNVRLGIKTATNGDYKIGISAVDGLFSNVNQNIYLEDTWKNVVHDLRQSAYSFTSEIGKFDNRFVLRYANQRLGNTDFQDIQNSVSIYTLNNEIRIDSQLKNIKEYEIYDVLGRVLTAKTGLDSNQTTSNSIAKTNQTLIIKITLEDNQVLVKRIIF